MNEKEILKLLSEDPETQEDKLNWTFKATKFLLLLQLEQIRTFRLIKKVTIIIAIAIASKLGIDLSGLGGL